MAFRDSLTKALKVTKTPVRFLSNGLLDVDCKEGKYSDLAQKNQLVSPFLQLPAEVRNRIYEFVLSDEKFEISHENQYLIIGKSERKKRAYLALLLVSRQIYAETALLPFSLNTFHANEPHHMIRCTNKFSLAARQSVISIQLTIDIHWHTDRRELGTVFPDDWWVEPNYTPNLPALRVVTIRTVLVACWCDKPYEAIERFLDHLKRAEWELKEKIESAHEGSKAVFERELNFTRPEAPLQLYDEDEDM
ncbi:beta transducin [Kalmusia sp. IMI 367209]|nr:beta transducin [Kalmusia sp. IMI 367209]